MPPPRGGHSHHACTPSSSQDASPEPPPSGAKSAKRRAAEELLQRRYSAPSAAYDDDCSPAATDAKRQRTTQRQQLRPPVRVAACSDCVGRADDAAWCGQDVALPPMDWSAVMQAVGQERDTPLHPRAGCHQLPGGIAVHVVSSEQELGPALGALRRSMQDACVAIDLEWRPEGWAGRGPSRIALLQLSSGSVAVLVRVCRLGYRMPPQLRAFLSDADLTFVGFSWDSSDEAKMVATFGEGRRQLFARFLDLQQVATSLGYHGLGLGALTRQVLGFQPPKCRRVTMSNWEARQLSARQVQYAALDALLTGHVYRGLRLWHASPSACTACLQMLGAVMPPPDWRCHDCSRSFASSGAFQSHRAQKKCRRMSPALCQECGRAGAGDGGGAALVARPGPSPAS